MSKLHLVTPATPNQNKKSYDNQRLRIQAAYVEIMWESHADDRAQIRQFAQTYMSFPTTAAQVYDALLVAFPQNVMCRAHDTLGITSIISNAFKCRADLRSSGGKKEGMTYSLIAPASRSKPAVVPVVAPSPVTPPTTAFATQASVDMLAKDVQNLSHTVGQLVQGLGGV